MFNRGSNREIKEGFFKGFFWLVYAILFGLIVFKFIAYING